VPGVFFDDGGSTSTGPLAFTLVQYRAVIRMSRLRRNRAPTLTLVPSSSLSSEGASRDQKLELDPHSIDRDVDWSILMARAQNDDRDVYRRLLNEITPYLRALSARRFTTLAMQRTSYRMCC
jgi:hypothetical protein